MVLLRKMFGMEIDPSTKRFVATTRDGEKFVLENCEVKSGITKKKHLAWKLTPLSVDSKNKGKSKNTGELFVNFLVPNVMYEAFRRWVEKGPDDGFVRKAFWKLVDNRSFMPLKTGFVGLHLVASDKDIDTSVMDTYELLEVRDNAKKKLVTDIVAKLERADTVILYSLITYSPVTKEKKSYYIFRVLTKDGFVWKLNDRMSIEDSFYVIATYKDYRAVDEELSRTLHARLRTVEEKFNKWLVGIPIALDEKEIEVCTWPSKLTETTIKQIVQYSHLVVSDEPKFTQSHVPKHRFITDYVIELEEKGVVKSFETVDTEKLIKKAA